MDLELKIQVETLLKAIHYSERCKSVHNQKNPGYLKLLSLGEKAIPVLVNYIRAEPDWWATGAIISLSKGRVKIPDENRGKLEQIAELCIKWGDTKFPPTAQDLFAAAKHAQKCGDWRMECVLYPDPETNYGWGYFAGNIAEARDNYEKAKKLREQALVLQQDHLKEIVKKSEVRYAKSS